jgi:hypothetical protein
MRAANADGRALFESLLEGLGVNSTDGVKCDKSDDACFPRENNSLPAEARWP